MYSRASWALYRSVATTTATPSPAWLTSPRARGQWSGIFMSSVTGQPVGIPMAHSPARSSPVKTSTTPGLSLAAETSIERILAWAWGLRRSAKWSIPGSRMSSVKSACPVRSAGSSLRSTLLPMYRRIVSVTLRLLLSVVLGSSCRLLHLQQVLPGVDSVLVLDEDFRYGAVLFRLNLVEALHHLDQADGVPRRDLGALLDVELAVRVGAPVEGAGHLRFNGLRQISSSLSLLPSTKPSLRFFRWPSPLRRSPRARARWRLRASPPPACRCERRRSRT